MRRRVLPSTNLLFFLFFPQSRSRVFIFHFPIQQTLSSLSFSSSQLVSNRARDFVIISTFLCVSHIGDEKRKKNQWEEKKNLKLNLEKLFYIVQVSRDARKNWTQKQRKKRKFLAADARVMCEEKWSFRKEEKKWEKK